MPVRIEEGKLLYHQTALKNLPSIIENGLLSRAQMISNSLGFIDVADPNIIEGRKVSGLENYVPFHFHPRTAFDYAIRGSHPNEIFIYLTIKRDYARAVGAHILPAHPLSNQQPSIYPYDEGFAKIDWDVMEITQDKAGYNPQVRMAECLFVSPISIEKLFSIDVPDEHSQKAVKELLERYKSCGHIYVNVRNTYF